jgi:DNA-binding FrmR family transcriptional regulator
MEVAMRTEKKDILNRLKRAEGQLRGIQKMIEDEQECIDIVTQLTAVRSSINRTLGLVIGNKINQVMENPVDNPEEQEAKIQQVLDMIVKK